jgi:cysteine desulfurase
MTGIYLDYNASTPIDPKVADAMRPLLDVAFGNPSSGHWAGRPPKAALEKARAQVAGLLGAVPEEIVFTSGGSEANNLALKGSFFTLREKGNQIITQLTEHPAILKPLAFLERLGADVTRLPVDDVGRVDPAALRRAITPRTILITIMHANNETGTIQAIEEIGAIAREYAIRFHTDAAQSVGKIPTIVERLGVDLLSVAGHKLYAPKGIGALYVRGGVTLEPLIHGADHERGHRAGTESALLATALGKACDVAREWVGMPSIQRLRDHFWDRLRATFSNRVLLNGHPLHRLPNTLNVSFVGDVGAEILARMPDIAASTGSACHSGQITLSPVLEAMGVTSEVGAGSIRFSLGRATTLDEIKEVVDQLSRVIRA